MKHFLAYAERYIRLASHPPEAHSPGNGSGNQIKDIKDTRTKTFRSSKTTVSRAQNQIVAL